MVEKQIVFCMVTLRTMMNGEYTKMIDTAIRGAAAAKGKILAVDYICKAILAAIVEI